MMALPRKKAKRLSHRRFKYVSTTRRTVTAIGSARPRMRFLQRSLGIVDFLHSWGEFRSAMSMLMDASSYSSVWCARVQPAGVLGGLQRNPGLFGRCFKIHRTLEGMELPRRRTPWQRLRSLKVCTCQIFIKAAYSTTYVTPKRHLPLASRARARASMQNTGAACGCGTKPRSTLIPRSSVTYQRNGCCQNAARRWPMTLHAQHIGLMVSGHVGCKRDTYVCDAVSTSV